MMSPEPSQSSFHCVGETALACSFHSSLGLSPSIAITR